MIHPGRVQFTFHLLNARIVDIGIFLGRQPQSPAAVGFDLRVASGFRSFDRQLAIWNGKAAGSRPIHDDVGLPIDRGALGEDELIAAILRFSALPGASRHHWGSDMDVYDAAAVPEGYAVQLSPAEVADDGPFGALHREFARVPGLVSPG